MKTCTFAAPLLAALTLAAPALAAEFTLGALTVEHPFAYTTAITAQSGGGYMTITNTGDTPDRLIEVRADFPKVEVHTTEMTDGVARMMHIEALDIPAGETVTLQPGGYHVMFMGLDGDPFELGETVAATLIFETAGALDVVFTIEARPEGGAPAMDHSGHGAKK